MKKQVSLIVCIVVAVIIAVVLIGSTGKKDEVKTPTTSTTPASQTTTPSTKTSTSPTVKNVSIVGFAFSLKDVTIKVGDTVTWTNADDTNHTVTADDTMTGSLDSPILHKGETYSYVFSQAGTFKYHCKFHTTMTGTITVTN